MDDYRVISDEVLDKVELALKNGNHWMAYNNTLYFIDKSDVEFFSDKSTANQFAENNVSENDHYAVMHISTIEDLLRKIPYREVLNSTPNQDNLYHDKEIDFTHSQLLNDKKLNFMNEQNFEYLKDNIKYMGFGEKHIEELQQNLKEGKEGFQLTINADINKKSFEAVLNFRKSDNSDMYFFNNYHASLERNNGEKVEQTFYLNKGKGVTAKEAYNLLEGRAVHKELSNKAGEPYKAWLQLDFDNRDKNNNHEVKQFHENYGYDLKASLDKFPIVELDGAEKEDALMQSLKKGNVQSVNMENDGTSNKMFIEANPQFKTLTVYDAQMKRMQKEELNQVHTVQQTQGKEMKQEQGKEMKQEQKEELKPDKKKEVKQKAGDGSTGPQKKTPRKRKGMSA